MGLLWVLTAALDLCKHAIGMCLGVSSDAVSKDCAQVIMVNTQR